MTTMKRLAVILAGILLFYVASPITLPVSLQAASEDNVKEIILFFCTVSTAMPAPFNRWQMCYQIS